MGAGSDMGKDWFATALGAANPVVGGVLGILMPIKAAAEKEQMAADINYLKRLVVLIKMHGSEGLKIQYCCHWLAGGGMVAYALAGKHGGIFWSDRESKGLFWHPDSNFTPQQSVYWYFKQAGAKPYPAVRLLAGNRPS